jgi:hypothetical protein
LCSSGIAAESFSRLGGKLIAISLTLTLIVRHLLAARPAFLLTAGQRGGGKTTLMHMLTMAIFGRMASATSWSENQEERRKALFAHLRQGVASLVWDNIKLGTEIACPEVEKALTSPTVHDRVLGVSTGETVPTTAIQIFVGNNIKFAGDMASRGPEIRLVTDDPRPEDRAVAHADPIAWTRAHRAQILRALYTILIYGCRNRPNGQLAKTRFKTWWNLAGWPVEHAASLLAEPVALDFVTVFKEAEEHDSKAAGAATALRLLQRQFGSIERGAKPGPADWFRARQIRKILDDGDRAHALIRTDVDAQARIDLANEFLELVADLTGKRHLNPITNVIGAALSGIIGRPVALDDTTIGILRARIIDGNNQFLVETHSGGPAPETIEGGPATGRKTGKLSHCPTSGPAGEGAERGSKWDSGMDRAYSDRFAGENQKFREGVSRLDQPCPDRTISQPPVEEACASGPLVLDIETFSTVDLKVVGLHYYAAHTSTGVAVACYAFGATGEVQTWLPGEPVPEAVLQHIAAGGQIIAHNAAFERELLRCVLGPRHGWPVPELRQWSCTLARAAYYGFPRVSVSTSISHSPQSHLTAFRTSSAVISSRGTQSRRPGSM